MAVLFRVTALQSADEVHHSNRGHEEGKAEGQELQWRPYIGLHRGDIATPSNIPDFRELRRGLFYFRKSFGNFAMFAAIRRASSFVSSLAADSQCI
jgi:hypothetical protein